MGVGVAILAVDVTDIPGRVLYVSGRMVKRYGVLSFFDYFIMKDKAEFLNKSEN